MDGGFFKIIHQRPWWTVQALLQVAFGHTIYGSVKLNLYAGRTMISWLETGLKLALVKFTCCKCRDKCLSPCPKKGKVISGNIYIPQMLLEFRIKLLLSYEQSGVNIFSASASHDGFSSACSALSCILILCVDKSHSVICFGREWCNLSEPLSNYLLLGCISLVVWVAITQSEYLANSL